MAVPLIRSALDCGCRVVEGIVNQRIVAVTLTEKESVMSLVNKVENLAEAVDAALARGFVPDAVEAYEDMCNARWEAGRAWYWGRLDDAAMRRIDTAIAFARCHIERAR